MRITGVEKTKRENSSHHLHFLGYFIVLKIIHFLENYCVNYMSVVEQAHTRAYIEKNMSSLTTTDTHIQLVSFPLP